MFALERLIPSKARRKLLLFFLEGGKPQSVRQAARKAGVSPSVALGELKNLEAVGILKMREETGQTLYSVNEKCEVLGELRGIAGKALDLRQLLRERLLKIEGIEIAFIFGSYADKSYGSKSDIDVFIVGKPNMGGLNREISELEGELGKSIDYYCISASEFRKKFRNGGFVRTVSDGKKIFLVGDENEFGRLA